MAGDEEHDVRPGELVVVRCGFCGGRGIYPFGHPPSQAQCGVCKGRGWVYVVAPYILCPVCGGTGRISDRWMTCRRCAGKGVISVRGKSE